MHGSCLRHIIDKCEAYDEANCRVQKEALRTKIMAIVSLPKYQKKHEVEASQPSCIEEGVCCDLSRGELNPTARSDEAASLICQQRVNSRPSIDYFTADLLGM